MQDMDMAIALKKGYEREVGGDVLSNTFLFCPASYIFLL